MTAIAAQILGNRFAALAREGAERFAAMSRGPLVIEEGQYACAILDEAGRLIAQDQGEPSQIAAVQATVARTLDAFAYNLSDGDVLLTGDPYWGGTWAGVLTLMVPVFHQGEMRFVVAIRFAAADLAGDIPGPFQPAAHEIWQEALRVSPVKLVRAGAPQGDVRAYVLRNSRASAVLGADLAMAQVNARRIGARLSALVADRGLDAVLAAAEARIGYGAARAQAALAGLRAGEGASGPVRVRLVPGQPVAVDLADSAAAVPGAGNLTLATTRGVVLTQLLGPVIEDAGLSQGILDAVSIAAPAGSLLDAPFPAALSLGWRQTAPHLAAALAEASGTAPAIWPAPPLVVLFPEIGSGPVAQAVALSPGFVTAPGCAGSDAAAGRRRLVSAEEAEVAGLFRLDRRERTAAGGIAAAIRIAAPRIEGIVVPGAGAPDLHGASPRPRSAVLSLPPGTRIDFHYPAEEGSGDDDARL